VVKGRVRPLTFGHKEAILARRKELQVRTLVARRERYREMMGTVENAGARAPKIGLNSPPICAADAEDVHATM